MTQLQRLLLFLRHEKYGITKSETLDKASNGGGSGGNDSGRRRGNNTAKSAWDETVKIPFLREQPAGRDELFHVLKEVMVMHKKEDIGLPKPIFKQGEVSVHIPPEVGNHITKAVEGMDFQFLDLCQKLTIGHYESNNDDPNDEIARRQRRMKINLLAEKISHAREVGGKTLFDCLLNEHMSTDDFQNKVDKCQGEYIEAAIKREIEELERRGGAINGLNSGPLTAASDHYNAETFTDRRPIKAVVYSNSTSTLLSVLEHLYDKFDDENIAELTEGRIDEMAYQLGRFRLNRKEGKRCNICHGWNEYKGKELHGCKNLLLEVSDVDGNIFLIEQERILRAVGLEDLDRADCVGNPVEMARLGGAPLNKYGISRKFWRLGDALCIDAREPHPLFRARLSEEQWSAMGSGRCMELFANDGGEGGDNYFGPLPHEEGNNNSQLMVKLRKWQPWCVSTVIFSLFCILL